MKRRAATARVVAALALALLGWSSAAGPAGARPAVATQDPNTTLAPTATTPPTTAAPIITTTLPESDADLGRIIPLPNSGVEPEEPGDRGGWQQLALFVMVCLVIVAMGVFVWWRSRIARDRRRAEGHDPVTMAREHGGDMRKPRPPGIVD